MPNVYISEFSLGNCESISSWSVSDEQGQEKERRGQCPHPVTKSPDSFTHSFIHQAIILN